MHMRQQIREAVASLITGLPLTGANVYQSHIYNFDQLPCLAVYTTEEIAERNTMNRPASVARELTLVVEIRLKQVADFDDDLDQISADVEQAIATQVVADRLGGLVRDIEYTGIDIDLQSSTETDKPSPMGAMEFLVKYEVLETDVENPN